MPDRGMSYIWVIVERFYRGERLYRVQYETYERLVAQYVKKIGLPRTEIRLGAKELSGLLQFKQLERIRDAFLEPLKQACHDLFRRDNSTDILDRLVNDIFHEISILKEEHYNVLTYQVNPESAVDREEQKAILDEVHEMFPIKVHRMKHLFDTARARLEKTLPRFKEDRVLIRSLFLNRDEFVIDAYPNGILDFYRVIYGKKKVYEGFRRVGDSFFEGGFYEKAMEAYEAGAEYLNGLAPSSKRKLDPEWKDARDHFRKQRREAEVRLASLELVD